MDISIWENTIVAWVNCLNSSTPIRNVNQINNSVLTDIIKKIKSNFKKNPAEFLKDIFPHLFDYEPFMFLSCVDYLCAATLLLIYVSFSQTRELEILKEVMCKQLDNSVQMNIAEFLMSIQKHENIFHFSLETVKQQISNFAERHAKKSMTEDSKKTPLKSNLLNNNCESPLQEFFQTPKKSQSNKRINCSLGSCGDGDQLKLIQKLTDQLVQEEFEKTCFQEQLTLQTEKCNEYEIKLRNKLEEINQLKYEWENEAKTNEVEFKSLKDNIMQKIEDEKKLKNELSHLENYAKTLESDLSSALAEKDKLEFELKAAMEKCCANELELREATESNLRLKNIVENNEKDLAQFRNEYVTFYGNDKTIDVSFTNESFDKSICPPESMGVVLDILLEEKKEENKLLKKTVEEMQKENNRLLDEINQIKEKLESKSSTISELQFLNRELSVKIENLDLIEKDLFKVQKDLVFANAEINSLREKNVLACEKYNSLHSNLEEQIQTLLNYKNVKFLLQVDLLKLAEEFKAVQEHLEFEIKNILKLSEKIDTEDNLFHKSFELSEIGKGKEVIAYDSFSSLNVERIKDVHKSINSKKIIPLSNQCSDVIFDNWEKITEFFHYFEIYYVEWSELKIFLQKTCRQLSDNVVALQTKMAELGGNKKSFEEKMELKKQLRRAEEEITECQSLHSSEIENFKQKIELKESKIRELKNIILELEKSEQNLINENEILKKQTTKLNKESALEFVYEGGDYSITKSGDSGIRFTEMGKILESIRPQQEFNDSLEEVPVCNKTFDIVNLEEKDINNKTFSVKKDADISKKISKSNSAWVVSPPNKIAPKTSFKKPVKGFEKKQKESSVIPLTNNKLREKEPKNVLSFFNHLSVKAEPANIETSKTITKSSSLSSILEIDYSPPSKNDSKSSAMTSYFSITDLNDFKKTYEVDEISQNVKEKTISQVKVQKVRSLEQSFQNFRLIERNENPLDENVCRNDSNKNLLYNMRISELQKENTQLSKECERLRCALLELEQKRKQDKEVFEKHQDIIEKNIESKYQTRLEYLKNEMKQLHNKEMAKHNAEHSKLNFELQEQNKRFREHNDELRKQQWDLREKLLQEQKSKRDLERINKELKKKYESIIFSGDLEAKTLLDRDTCSIESLKNEYGRGFANQQIPNSSFPTIPTEDEDEVFDSRFLEDMKAGLCKVERPEGRLMELQYRNSLCLPHLKSSYPGETQFHMPTLFKENDLKLGFLQFGQESQSLTDSDHSMTKSLLPETNKGKKKEKTSYKKPGPPTPCKNKGRLSIQSGDLQLTPRNVLKELNDQGECGKGTPNSFKGFLPSKSVKSGSLGGKDENSAPVTPRKKNKFFRKPFGAKDH